MSFRVDDVTRFVENYAAYHGLEYKSKPLSSGDILITLGNATGRLDNRSSKIRPDLIENFLKSLFGQKKEWDEAVTAFFRDGGYKFRSEYQTADLVRFIEDYSAYRGVVHTTQPNDKGGSVITLSEASAEIDTRQQKINHNDVDGVFTLLFGKRKKWPTEAQEFFANGKYKFKGERPAKPAAVATATVAAPDTKRVFAQRAPVQPPINLSAPSGFAAASQRWGTHDPYRDASPTSKIAAQPTHFTIDSDAIPDLDNPVESRRGIFQPADVLAFIEDYASRLGSNYAVAPHDKGGLAVTLGARTAKIDNQKAVLTGENVKQILIIFFGKQITWADEVADFYEKGFHPAIIDKTAATDATEAPSGAGEETQTPTAKPIDPSAADNRAKHIAENTAAANGLTFNPSSIAEFVQNYAAHYGYDHTSEPHNKGGVIVTLGTRSARVYNKKSKIIQSDLEDIFIELFGKKKVWPSEARDFFEQGSYTFSAATTEASAGPVAPAADDKAKPSAPAGKQLTSLPARTDKAAANPFGTTPVTSMSALMSSSSAILTGSKGGQQDGLKDLIASVAGDARKPPVVAKPAAQKPPAKPAQETTAPADTTAAARPSLADKALEQSADIPAFAPPSDADEQLTATANEQASLADQALGQAADIPTFVPPKAADDDIIRAPIAPVTIQRPDLQIIPATFDTDIPARSQHVMLNLLHHGLVKADDSVRTAAEKVAALMNKHPAVLAKNGAFDISGDEVFKYLDRPQYAFSTAAWTTPLTAYRIWQTAHYFNTNLERMPPALNAFWSPAENPQPATDNAVYAIARDVYVQHVLPVLDRDTNRHFQTLEQLNEAAGFTDAGFRNFMSYAWTVWRSEGGFGKNVTLDDVKNATDIVPSDYLSALEKVLGCRGEQIFPFEAWHRILGDEPAAMLQRGAPLSGKKFSMDDLSDASKAVLKRISDAGFTDLDDVVSMLNHRLEDVANLPDGKDFTVSIETIGRAISRRQPYPKGFADLVCLRITEVVNERRAERGLTEPLTAETLFGVKRNPKRTFQHDAEDMLMSVLQQPQNKHLLTIYRVAWAYGGKLDDLTAFYDNLSKAYVPNEETGPQPSDDLKRLASALGVEPTALLPHSIWERAQLQQANIEAGQIIATDGRVVDSEIEAPTNFLARAEARQREVAEATRLRELRVQIITSLHARILEMATRPDVVTEVAEPHNSATLMEAAATPGDTTPVGGTDALVSDTPTDAVIPAAAKPDAPLITLAAAPAAPPAADAQPLPVEADFRAAALEVVQAFRQLQSAQMVLELSLLDRVEGVNRKRKREDLLKVAEALSLELTEAREILEETKTDLAKSGSQKLDRELTHHQVIGALQEYQADIAGRSVLNSYLDAGRDEAKDADIGSNFRPPQSAEQVKSVRDRLIASMTSALQQQAPTGT